MATYGAASQVGATSAPANVSRPSGTTSGSYLVAFHSTDLNAPASSLTLSGGTTWNVLTSGTQGETTYKVYWKIAGAGEPTNYQANWDNSEDAYATIHIIRVEDADDSAPVFNVSTAGSIGTSVSTPGITPPDSTALEIRCAFGVGTGTEVSFTAPAGLTERTDVNASGYPHGSTATRTLSSSSPTGTLNFTMSGSLADRVGITVGVPTLTATPAQEIELEGIASTLAFGDPRLNMSLALSGVPSTTAFGASKLNMSLALPGVPSSVQFGDAVLIYDRRIGVVGIASTAVVGHLTARFPTQFVSLDGIAPAARVGSPTLKNLHRLILVNPSVQETPASWDRLGVRFGIHRGITIIKRQDGTIYSTRYPAQTEMEEAAKVWLGGRRHVLSGEEAAELIAAGFGQYIELELDD